MTINEMLRRDLIGIINECRRVMERAELELALLEEGEDGNKKPYPHCKGSCQFIKDGNCDYRNQHIPTIAVDFDRVLFTHESWQGHFNVGDPIPGAKEALRTFRVMGFKIMIWTTRAQKDIIADACTKAEIPFDYINENPNQPPEINPSKPVADYYIDDRALHFVSWEQTLIEIFSREKHDAYYPISQKSGGGP